MDEKKPDIVEKSKAENNTASSSNAREIEDHKFSTRIDKLARRAEENRLRKSKQYDVRCKIYYIMMCLLLFITSSWFIWALLMGDGAVIVGYYIFGGNLKLAGIAFVGALVISAALRFWAHQPLHSYIREFKSEFMPGLAESLGKLTFHPSGGVSAASVAPARILPQHEIYKAEDCFKGKYKGTNLLISEARLYNRKNKNEPVFDGVFVLLTIAKKKFRGHTIITSDHDAIKRYRPRRWQKLKTVTMAEGVKSGAFEVFSTQPEEAVAFADHDFMDLMNKLSNLFNGAEITAAFYGGRRIFLMIPYEDDMFEPGDIHMPVASAGHALKCKREIEQILSVIDVLDVYEPDTSLVSSGSDNK